MTKPALRLSLTPDLHSDWLNVLRRIQSAVKDERGAAVVTIHVVVNGNAEPRFWTEPQLIKIEPVSRAADIIRTLAR